MTAQFDKKIQCEDRNSVVIHTGNEDADMKTKLFALFSLESKYVQVAYISS